MPRDDVIESTRFLMRPPVIIPPWLQGCKIESRMWLSFSDLYRARGAQGVLRMRVGGATSQFYLPSLTQL